MLARWPSRQYLAAAAGISVAWYAGLVAHPFTRSMLLAGTFGDARLKSFAPDEASEKQAAVVLALAVILGSTALALLLRRRIVRRGPWDRSWIPVLLPWIGAGVVCALGDWTFAAITGDRGHTGSLHPGRLLFPLSFGMGSILLPPIFLLLFLPAMALTLLSMNVLGRVGRRHDLLDRAVPR